MKRWVMGSLAAGVAACGLAQVTNEAAVGGRDVGTRVADRGAEAVVAVSFVGPPVVEVPAVTSDVEVVETVVTTNLVAVVATKRVARRQVVVNTNATLRRFMVDIDENQNPVRFTSVFSDGSVVVTVAGDVGAMTNRAALSTFNGMLRDVIGNGRRVTNTNVWWQVRGSNAPAPMQRAWSSVGIRP